MDCDSIDHACILETEPGNFKVAVSFKCSQKVSTIGVADREQGLVVLSKLKRGMLAAITGNFDDLGNPPADFDDDEDDADGERTDEG